MIVYRVDLLVYFPTVKMHPLILSLISYPDSPLPLGFHLHYESAWFLLM